MNLGSAFQTLGILAGVASFVLYLMSINDKSGGKSYHKYATYLLVAQAVLVTFAVLMLCIALVTSDFRYAYVVNYTDKALPFIYKLTALWAGQAGSLLFWGWLASIFAAIEIFRIRTYEQKYQAYVFLAAVFTSTFFLFICTFVTTPFQMLDFYLRDGNGMNPMLQNPGMVIHPPLLYVGFVAFTIPFAHAFASSCKHDVTSYWVVASRPWAVLSWVFLTAGIVLGAWWAYVELGWGGYWAWDPVENASLFPWLTATAFLHAAIIYERKGRLKAWTYSLILITFELTIFGTYLTRSGIMTDSVHSFGQSALGNYFLIFIVITTVAYVIAMYKNRKSLSDNEEFNFASREGVFFVALLCFVALTIALIFYTMLPVITNFLGEKRSVQTASYNLVSIPFFTAIFFLAGIAPVVPYGAATAKKFLKAYLPIIAGALIILVVSIYCGFFSIAGVVLTVAAATTFMGFALLFVKIVKNGGIGAIFTARRAVGASLIHIGVALMAFGVIYSALYSIADDYIITQDQTFEFPRKDRIWGDTSTVEYHKLADPQKEENYKHRIKAYDNLNFTLSSETVHMDQVKNFTSFYAPLDIEYNGKYLITLAPEIREYFTTKQGKNNVYAEVSYYSMAKGDLYAILDGFDLDRDMIRIRIIYQPLIIWIWVGCVIMCIGAIYGMSQGVSLNKYKAPVDAGANKKTKGK